MSLEKTMKLFFCLFVLLFASSSILSMEAIDTALQNRDCPTAIRIFSNLKNPSKKLMLDLWQICSTNFDKGMVQQYENKIKDEENLFTRQELAYIYFNLAFYKCSNWFFVEEKKSTDLDEAFRFYKYAADLGHIDAPGILGQFYEDGRGVTKDLNEAIRLYKLSFDRGSVQTEKWLKKFTFR